MAKNTIFIILSICLLLQLATALPKQYTNFDEIQDNTISDEDLQNIKLTKPQTQSEFRKLLRPVILKSLALVEQHSNTLITETTIFVDNLLVELTLLPEDNALAEELIAKLRPLLDRMQKLNLYDESTPVLQEKAQVLMDISQMYRAFEALARSDDSNHDIVMVKKAFEKLQVKKLNERIDKSVQDAVQKFLLEFMPFWNALSDADKIEHQDLSDWYAHFQAASTAQAKFKCLVDFMRILKSIVLAGQ